MPSHISYKRTKPITKATLYIRAMKFFFWFGLAIGFLMIAMFTIMLFFVYSPLELREQVCLGVFSVVFVLLMFIVTGSLHIISRGFFRIAEQEAFFGIRFCDEMQNEQINETEHMSPGWFISARAAGVIVFRAGFITRINKIEKYYRGPTASRIIITTVNGKKMNVVGNYETIDNLLKWQEGDLVNRT